MGRELQRIGAPFRQPEWSALALMEAPETVAAAHHNFIAAGAEVITTNAYALVPFHIGQDRFDQQGFTLVETAAKIARDLADEHNITVAGSIPPAFGSYQPEAFNADQLEAILTPLIQAQDPYVDHFVIETTPSMIEADSVLTIVKRLTDRPIWLSFTLNNRDDLSQPLTLRSGESLDDIAPILDKIDAVLFNCSQPEEMADAVTLARRLHRTIPIGVYANSFSEIRRVHQANRGLSTLRDDLTPEAYLDFAKKWVAAGATIIGGCCGIGPDHIATLSSIRA